MKKITIRLLIVFIFLVSGTKLYYVLCENRFKAELKQMKENGFMNYKIESNIESKVLAVNENTIHYYVSGEPDKPAILFLHPAFSDHTCFYKQVDFFSKEFRVITIDLIGHGLSKVHNTKDKIDMSSEHILEIAKKEDINALHIVGVSMGSLIAQYFALSYPEKVLSLTTLGGYNINEENKEIAKSQRKKMFGWMIRVIFSMDSFRRYAGSVSAVNKEEQLKFYESAKGFSRKSFTIMSSLNRLIKDRPNPIRNYPLLILTGEKDNALAKQMAESWHIAEPNSKYYSVEQAGHCANMDNPKRFNEIVYNSIKNIK
ncbi:MAG: alpha/beta hydrolase [Tannerellaceae bacterium]|jgi:pimeloyl-ACP methyl ester carboxylesterase|nr:alpha/beta hydrolase [Tannerellaceae bacterium]